MIAAEESTCRMAYAEGNMYKSTT